MIDTYLQGYNIKHYSKEKIIYKYASGQDLNFTFFWKTSKGILDEGCFSQWQISHFSFRGIQYSSAEQFMMAHKAIAFNDRETLKEIMNESHPRKIKKLGRQIVNFNSDTWDKYKYCVALIGNYCKFDQNEKMKQILINTGDNIIVEASPYDKIWGVGLDENDSRIMNPLYWEGENLLGFVLMKVRDYINFDVFNIYN